MLVTLSVSIWSARKHDIRISDKVAAEHGADRSMGRYAKHLIPRELLTAVNAANTALREHHNLNTLAWGDDGTRILPAANYLGYQAQQQTLEDEFGRAVRDFVASYSIYVETARTALNGLFDPRDYPAPGRIAEKFAVRRHFLPVAQPDDFRVRLGDTRSPGSAPRSRPATPNWSRTPIATCGSGSRRSPPAWSSASAPSRSIRSPAPALHPFRDSLIENVRALLEIMPRLNLTGDAGSSGAPGPRRQSRLPRTRSVARGPHPARRSRRCRQRHPGADGRILLMSTASDLFAKARAALLVGAPFWGVLSLRLAPVEDPSIKTMQTDGVIDPLQPRLRCRPLARRACAP